MKLAFYTTPRCIDSSVATLAEVDEAAESEEREDGNMTRGIELGRLG